LNDLAGITEIEAIDLGAGSRRGSFSKPMGAAGRTAGSESKERPRDSSSGIPRPQTGATYDNKRPGTTGDSAGALRGYAAFGSSQDRQYDRKSNNPHSEVASSYKDDDDALSHYMDQSEYGGLSNLGGARQPTFANQLNA